MTNIYDEVSLTELQKATYRVEHLQVILFNEPKNKEALKQLKEQSEKLLEIALQLKEDVKNYKIK